MAVKVERPVITPELFSGEQSWEDWIDQFESIAAINGWSDEQKHIRKFEEIYHCRAVWQILQLE